VDSKEKSLAALISRLQGLYSPCIISAATHCSLFTINYSLKKKKRMLSVEEFIKQTGTAVSAEQLTGRSRTAEISVAREAYWYCLHTQHGMGYRRIASLAGRCKETVRSGLTTIRNLLETGHPLIAPFRSLLLPDSDAPLTTNH
jgi:hypothetical protein